MRMLGIVSVFFLAMSNLSYAEIIEEILHVPIVLDSQRNPPLKRPMLLTVVRDNHFKKSPFIVVHHGRPESAIKFAVMGQQRYPANSKYFAELGFVVLIPTRIGYGLTGGQDVEYTGECGAKNYIGGITPIISETKQLLAFAGSLPYVDSSRGIVVGESFGGVGAIAIASSDIKSVLGAINISGGDGGSLDHLDEPCRPDQLKNALSQYGSINHIPTLWMYSLNDRFWGTQYPKQWFDAFIQAGGKGEFVTLPADKNNGHYIFTRNASAWHPAFESFIHKLGF